MKTVILLHGTGGSDTDYYWFEDTKEFLEENGYEVWWPKLPNTDKPSLKETVDFVAQRMPSVDEQTVVIGHSSSCPLILHILPSFKIKVRQLVLVSGYYEKINEQSNKMLPESFDIKGIRNNSSETIMINSDNDPWGCDDIQARKMALKLNAKLIINTGEGHMGSTSFNQPYKEFELLKRMIKV